MTPEYANSGNKHSRWMDLIPEPLGVRHKDHNESEKTNDKPCDETKKCGDEILVEAII